MCHDFAGNELIFQYLALIVQIASRDVKLRQVAVVSCLLGKGAERAGRCMVPGVQ